MPNGISCAYFAARNHLYGQKEHNVFKEGIATAQTTRAVDSVTSVAVTSNTALEPVANFFGKAAALARKVVYPLIIASGIYNTAKSDDKVKTGVSQAGGIASMFVFEQAAEKGLNKIYSSATNTSLVKNNKAAKIACYILKGSAFILASLKGYSFGSNTAENIVDKLRINKIQKFMNKDVLNNISVDDTLFDDMQL
jgi:hypothetical protein